MKRKLLLVATLSLAACMSAGDDDNTLFSVRAAQSGMRVSMERIQHHEESIDTVPAPLSGITWAAIFGTSGEDITPIPSPIPQGSNGSDVHRDTELLSVLVSLLELDIQSVLNASRSREESLRQYRDSLESHTQRGRLRQRTLADRVNDLRDDQRRLGRLVRDLQGELESAINEGKSGDASLISDELVQKQSLLARAEADLMVTQQLLDSYGDLLEPLQERLDAINANRPALIQGIKIVDIPGVEDIGVIEYSEGIPQFRRRRRGLF